MTETITLRTDPRNAATPALLTALCAKELRIPAGRIARADITRRSIDARQRRVMVNLTVAVHIDTVDESAVTPEQIVYPGVEGAPEAVIVGAGPAGMFAALELIESGIRPIMLERGKDVDSRRRDMVAISREGKVDPDSNYCFGEGGAGAYSDGKLYTRSKKRGPVEKVLRIFHQHGAQHDILVDAHPHIGTDRLPSVIKAMRETIIGAGGEVHFSTRVTRLIIENGNVAGVMSADGKQWRGPVILATGHSARDVYHSLADDGVRLEAKGIAIGVRLEHPQHLIDQLQYHSPQGRGKYLPAAEYSMLTRIDDRGMSPANRGTRWANSGMVVEILPEDIPDREGNDKENALKMMRFQEKIEQSFFEAAGKTQQAPAQRMADFVEGRLSDDLPKSSYPLREGFKVFGAKQRGFLTNEAVLIGDETRTSSPVRIPRDPVSLVHTEFSGLYPCGEGAGYAGGIVSAAIDGIMTARALAATLR